MNAVHLVEAQYTNQCNQNLGRLQFVLAESIKQSLNGKAKMGRSPEVIDLIRNRFQVAFQKNNIRCKECLFHADGMWIDQSLSP
jgi:hypothetical protein